jgi:hypothetical protein
VAKAAMRPNLGVSAEETLHRRCGFITYGCFAMNCGRHGPVSELRHQFGSHRPRGGPSTTPGLPTVR